jgi:AcrR family transcriptional regulator
MLPLDPAPQPIKPLFPRLTGGPGRMPPEAVARHQRARLLGAMVEAVARHGYAGTTLRELVALAGVSRSTFYAHFESKQECFLATFDEIVRQVTERVGSTYRSTSGFRERLHSSLAAFFDLVVEEPDAATLVTVESLTLGAAGVEHRERGSEAFELMIRQSFDHSDSPHKVSDTMIKAIVAGIRGVVYRRLRAGQREQLPGYIDELVDWGLSYQSADSPALHRATRAASAPTEVGDKGPADPEAVSWEEPPDSSTSRATLTQRERILRGAARVVAEKGYDALSIPAISAAAGVSNQTFYENFSSKRDAFLASFEIIAQETLAATASAFETAGDRPEAVGIGMRAMLEHIADNKLFGRFAFFELPSAGPVALDYADAVMDNYTSFLGPGELPKEFGEPLPPVVLEAIGSGIWTLIQNEIVHGRTDSLPELAPDLTRVALMPFGAR